MEFNGVLIIISFTAQKRTFTSSQLHQVKRQLIGKLMMELCSAVIGHLLITLLSLAVKI